MRKTAIQALDRLDPVLPLSRGRAERHGFEYHRHGTLSLYAALDTKTGRVHGKTAARHTLADFVDFLGEVVSQCRPEQYHSRQSVGAQNASRTGFSASAFACQVAFHTDVFLMAESGRAVVRQNRARCHRSWRVHFGA
jgi:hypothetical protein